MNKLKTIFVIALVLSMAIIQIGYSQRIVFGNTTYTATLYTSSSDGYLECTGANYNEAWIASSATGNGNTATQFYLGQINSPLRIFRLYLYFDTSSFSKTTIYSANLYMHGYSNARNINLTIQNGQPTYPHDPLSLGDYDKSIYSGNGGSLVGTWNAIGWNVITLNSQGISWINKAGTTKLCVRNSSDIEGLAPTGQDFIRGHLYESGANIPYLEITYSPSDANTSFNNLSSITSILLPVGGVIMGLGFVMLFLSMSDISKYTNANPNDIILTPIIAVIAIGVILIAIGMFATL